MRAVVIATATILAAGLAAAQTVAHVGTWRVNLATSTFPAGTAPKSQIRVYAMDGDMLTSSQTSVQADGTTVVSTYSARFDGRDYPAIGSPAYDTIAITRVDSHVFEAELKRGGVIVQRARNEVSADGRTMTVRISGPGGKKTIAVIVLEKQ
jgi:hypothetical protein